MTKHRRCAGWEMQVLLKKKQNKTLFSFFFSKEGKSGWDRPIIRSCHTLHLPSGCLGLTHIHLSTREIFLDALTHHNVTIKISYSTKNTLIHLGKRNTESGPGRTKAPSPGPLECALCLWAYLKFCVLWTKDKYQHQLIFYRIIRSRTRKEKSQIFDMIQGVRKCR